MTERHKLGMAAGVTAGVGTGLGILLGIEPESIVNFLSQAANSQIAQFGFFFTLAAWMHSGRVKKEIKLNFIALTDAINNVALTLRRDLDLQKEILENHSLRIHTLEEKK